MTAFSFLSTYPPTRCGLATFSESLATAIAVDGPDSLIVRMMDELARPATPAIRTRSRIVAELGSVGSAADGSIRQASRSLNQAQVAIVQHEYGIYGGEDGDDVLRVLAQLTVPSIVVLHTVLDTPTAGQRAVLERVGDLADAVVVMTEAARVRLASYSIDAGKVSVIPHGVPSWTPEPRAHPRDRRTVLTWGLIGPGKGIEHGIRAIAELADMVPPVHYRVSGQTHPKVLAQDGDVYRQSLHALVAELGVGDRVSIEDDYLDAAQLAAHVRDADLVLLPYDSRDQVTSGVLVEAIAAGKPVVATGFPHAVELIHPGAGAVVEHENPSSMARGIRSVVDRLGAGDASRIRVMPVTGTTWGEVALRYRELAQLLTTRRVDLFA